MMKHSKILALFLAISFALVLSGIAQQQAEETVTCPVSGKEIKKSEAKATYEYEGKTYYFCSTMCKDEFMKNPEKYTQKQEEEIVTCPVSGKKIKKSEAKATYEYEGKTYYFCCEKCKPEFMKNPGKYTQKKAEMKAVYTCPKHPEVKCDKPGKCSKCGMKLEKKMMGMKHMQGQMKMHKKSEGKACWTMMSLIGSKDVEVNVENLENGVAVKITSKKADVAKKIQEGAVKMKKMCMQKVASCKKEKKKEEKKEAVKKL